MPRFCVNRNAQDNGDHEVHELSGNCPRLPNLENRHALGEHASCRGAVQEAKRLGYSRANGCYWCARDCHSG